MSLWQEEESPATPSNAASKMADVARYYEVLGLAPGATREQVKQAFRELARQWHPDTVAQDPERHRVAQEKMKDINAAYEFLRSHRSALSDESPIQGGQSQIRQDAEAMEQRIRAIERLYLETVEQQRRVNNGLCRECGQPLTKIEKLLGNKSHGRCEQRNAGK